MRNWYWTFFVLSSLMGVSSFAEHRDSPGERIRSLVPFPGCILPAAKPPQDRSPTYIGKCQAKAPDGTLIVVKFSNFDAADPIEVKRKACRLPEPIDPDTLTPIKCTPTP